MEKTYATEKDKQAMLKEIKKMKKHYDNKLNEMKLKQSLLVQKKSLIQELGVNVEEKKKKNYNKS